MTKIKILQVSATNKKKDGSEMPNNTLKVGLKVNRDDEEVWLNGIVEKGAMTFEVGQEVELEISQGQYGWEFKAPTLATKLNQLENKIIKLENDIRVVMSKLDPNKPLEANSSPSEPSEEEKQKILSEIPFN